MGWRLDICDYDLCPGFVVYYLKRWGPALPTPSPPILLFVLAPGLVGDLALYAVGAV